MLGWKPINHSAKFNFAAGLKSLQRVRSEVKVGIVGDNSPGDVVSVGRLGNAAAARELLLQRRVDLGQLLTNGNVD